MADIHFDAGGSNTSPFDTTAKASTTVAGASIGTGAAGNRYLFSSSYSESASSFSIAPTSATNANPYQMLSGTLGSPSGITALVAGATLIATGSSSIVINGAGYVNGFTLRCSSASSNAIAITAGSGYDSKFENCNFEQTGAGSFSTLQFGNTTLGGGSRVILTDCGFKFGAAGQGIDISGEVLIEKGSILSGGTSPTSVFKINDSTRSARLTVIGTDFSNCSAGVNLVGDGQGGSVAIFRDIKVPASWSGVPITSGNIQPGQRVEVWGYTDGTTKRRAWIVDYHYSMVEENTIVMTGGANDEATYAYKMTSTANVSFTSPARGPDMVVQNDTSGASKTITVEVIHDSATALNDDEIWLEVEAPLSSSAAGQKANDAKASVIASAAAQSSSSVTWTTTGLTNPNKQKLEVTLTPDAKGPLICRVMLGKASKVVYFNPEPAIA